MYGDDYQYAASRLDGTIVRTAEGTVVLVERVHEDGVCSCIDLASDLRLYRPLNSLNLKPVPLGFVNHRNKVHYVTRVPRRGDYRQGLRKENSQVLVGNYPPFHVIVNTITNQFPSFDNAIALSSKYADNSCAWHRHWAVRNGKTLLYKGFGQVGEIGKDRSFKLQKEFEYLKEYLMECL